MDVIFSYYLLYNSRLSKKYRYTLVLPRFMFSLSIFQDFIYLLKFNWLFWGIQKNMPWTSVYILSSIWFFHSVLLFFTSYFTNKICHFQVMEPNIWKQNLNSAIYNKFVGDFGFNATNSSWTSFAVLIFKLRLKLWNLQWIVFLLMKL